MKIKTDPECNTDDDERRNVLDDFSFDNTMLKQIPDRCKTKKRKRLNFVGLDKETMETCSGVKQEYPNFQHKDENYDLEETLTSRKSKLSKNLKNSDEDSLQLNRVWPEPIDVKVEVPETTNIHILKTDMLDPTKEAQYCSLSEVSYEYMENFETKLEMGVSGSEILQVDNSHMIKEPEYCSLNEVSFEYRDNFETVFDARVSSWETVGVCSPEIIKETQYCSLNELSDVRMDNFETKSDVGVSGLETVVVHSPEIMKEPQYCSDEYVENFETKFDVGVSTWESVQVHSPIKCNVSDEVPYESTEDVPKFGVRFSGCETVKVDSPEMISYQCSELQEFGKERYNVYPLAYVVPSVSVSPTKDHCTDLHDSFKGNSSEHKMASQTINYGRAEAPEMDNDGLYWSSSCLNTERHSGLVSVDSSLSKNKSLSSAFIGTDYIDVSVNPLASPGPQVHHQTKHHHQHCATRLLSSRKVVISPTSRERLCQAMGLTRLDEEECHQCRGELNFGKQTDHRILRVQGVDQLCRDGVTTKPKSTMTKAKQDKKGSPVKGILKVTHPSRSRSDNVIAFTELQMEDFKILAKKLTIELNSMKDLVKGKLHSESEVRVAIENATGAEETAKRWLFMFASDCKRFCKIMRLDEDSNATPERVIQKESRSETVIAFTQQQRNDFKYLAMELITELKTMINLVKAKFHSESKASAATFAKENADEVGIALDNATRAEETARRGLSKLARDGTRFCEIMRSNAVREIQKERKVHFADEVGRKLWHAKEF